MRTLSTVLFMSLAGAASAQSSLGITGGEVSLGYVQDESGTPQIGVGAAVVNVAITPVHGIQGELSFFDTDGGGIGSIGAHLFMSPSERAKYGIFTSISDVEGRPLSWATLGVEGVFELGPNTTANARTGIGYGSDSLDFIFAGVGVSHEMNGEVTLKAALDLAHFDERYFDALSYELSVQADYQPENSRFGTFTSVTYSGLSGNNRASGDIRVGLGVKMTFGRGNRTGVKSEFFRQSNPVAPLLRRNISF